MEPVNPRLAELIAAETEAVAPASETRARHWAAVGAAFTPGPLPPAGASGGEAAAVTATGGSAVLKVVGGAVVALAVTAGVWTVVDGRDDGGDDSSAASVQAPVDGEGPDRGRPVDRQPPPPDASVLPEPADPVAEPAEPPPVAVLESEQTPPQPPPVTPPSKKSRSPRGDAAPPSRPPGLAEELALVESLRRAVVAGHHAQALRLAKRHAREFVGGALTPDRLDLQATAACASGDLEVGRALVKKRTAGWPKAPTSHRVETTCKLDQP